MKKTLYILLSLALLIGLMLPIALPVAAASPGVLAGNDVIDRTLPDTRTNFYLIDTNNPFDFDCGVTGWNIYADASVPVGFMIYRLTGSTWSVIYNGSGSADLKTPVADQVNSYSLSTPIQVKAGDYVGLYSGSGAGAVSFDWVGSNILYTPSNAGPTAQEGASARTYSVNAIGVINYGFSGLLSPYATPDEKAFKVGSSIPLKWQYTDAISGDVIDSADAAPMVKIIGVGAEDGEEGVELEDIADPGLSGLRYDSLTQTWQFNWQTKGQPAGRYNISIYSYQNGVTNGPFPILLRQVNNKRC